MKAEAVEICTAPGICSRISGHASDLHASHGSASDTTCTARSNYSCHVYHLHSKEACDVLLLQEPVLHDYNTAHRTDALQHTCHESVSSICHTFALHSYPVHTFHNRCLFSSCASHNISRLSIPDSQGKHRVSLVYWALLLTSGHKKSPKGFWQNPSRLTLNFTFSDTTILPHIHRKTRCHLGNFSVLF